MNENDNQIEEAELASLSIRRVHSKLFKGGGYRSRSLREAITPERRGARS